MEYVYSNNEGLVLNNVQGGTVLMRQGELWEADHPFVAARPDLFSATPTVVIAASGRLILPGTPLPKKARARA